MEEACQALKDTRMAPAGATATTVLSFVMREHYNVWRPLGVFSKKLSDTESRYSTYDRELLAAFTLVKHYSSILEGCPFTLFTDHKPLSYATQQLPEKASPRQARQLDYLL